MGVEVAGIKGACVHTDGWTDGASGAVGFALNVFLQRNMKRVGCICVLRKQICGSHVQQKLTQTQFRLYYRGLSLACCVLKYPPPGHQEVDVEEPTLPAVVNNTFSLSLSVCCDHPPSPSVQDKP